MWLLTVLEVFDDVISIFQLLKKEFVPESYLLVAKQMPEAVF